jgi:hypothetical protein
MGSLLRHLHFVPSVIFIICQIWGEPGAREAGVEALESGIRLRPLELWRDGEV